jgi:hypothetical protein
MAQALLAALVACATPVTEPLVERIDASSGTSLKLAGKPVEMITETGRGASSDPFAYFAPFETSNAGRREWYAWISVARPSHGSPSVRCDGQDLALQPVTDAPASLSLSRPPYSSPSPLSMDWYLRLDPSALNCLSSTRRLVVLVPDENGKNESFVTDDDALLSLRRFLAAAPLP